MIRKYLLFLSVLVLVWAVPVSAQDSGVGEEDITYSSEEGEEKGGSGYIPDYRESLRVDYTALAYTLQTGCNPVRTGDSIAYPTATINLDSYFVIRGKADWLPPRPSNPDTTIAGVDADGDCVRDDIEHYIAGMFPRKEQYKTRKYIFDYAYSLGRFLLPNLPKAFYQLIVKDMYKSSECVRREIGATASTEIMLKRLFARFHNTYPRSDRYIENSGTLFAWVAREEVAVFCY